MKYVILLSFISISQLCFSQEDEGIHTPTIQSINTTADPSLPSVSTSDTTVIATPAQYPGGLPALRTFLTNNLQYPQEAADNDIEGTVIVQFTVCKDGTMCDYKVLKNPSPLLTREALRVIKKMPKWEPALDGNNNALQTYAKQPITFQLQRDEPEDTDD